MQVALSHLTIVRIDSAMGLFTIRVHILIIRLCGLALPVHSCVVFYFYHVVLMVALLAGEAEFKAILIG